jgi:RNA polymerase sigma-70 factor (ECF subfamily)
MKTEAALAQDRNWVSSAAAGDVRAFESLMRHHNRAMFRTARAILKDDAEAEDALQEAYLQAYRSLGSFRADARFSTWLARIVVNESLMRLRKHTRRASIVPIQAAAPLEEVEQVSDDNMAKPDSSAERAEMRRLLEAQIDRLPDAYRTVFMLRAVEGLDVRETAECLGVNATTVRTRMFRAQRLLRVELSRRFHGESTEIFDFGAERCDRVVAFVLARLPR